MSNWEEQAITIRRLEQEISFLQEQNQRLERSNHYLATLLEERYNLLIEENHHETQNGN